MTRRMQAAVLTLMLAGALVFLLKPAPPVLEQSAPSQAADSIPEANRSPDDVREILQRAHNVSLLSVHLEMMDDNTIYIDAWRNLEADSRAQLSAALVDALTHPPKGIAACFEPHPALVADDILVLICFECLKVRVSQLAIPPTPGQKDFQPKYLWKAYLPTNARPEKLFNASLKVLN